MKLDVCKVDEAAMSAEASAITNAYAAPTNPNYPDEQRHNASSEAATTSSTLANTISFSMVHGPSAEQLKRVEQEREEAVAEDALRAFKAKQVVISYFPSNVFSFRLLSCLVTDAS